MTSETEPAAQAPAGSTSTPSTVATGSPEPSAIGLRQMLFHTVTAAVVASLLMVLLHELAHLATGLALGSGGTLYSFGVEHDQLSHTGEVVALLAGPVFSLITGGVMIAWTPLRKQGSWWHLLWIWYAFASVQEGVAYLCLTPFGVGDTGIAASMVHVPVAVQFVVLALGVAGMFVNARLFATHLARHCGPDHKLRMMFSLYPWLIGMGIAVLLSILHLNVATMALSAGNQMAIIMAGTAILVFAPMSNIFHRHVEQVAHEPLTLPRLPVAGLVLFVILTALNFVLDQGMHVG